MNSIVLNEKAENLLTLTAVWFGGLVPPLFGISMLLYLHMFSGKAILWSVAGIAAAWSLSMFSLIAVAAMGPNDKPVLSWPHTPTASERLDGKM